MKTASSFRVQKKNPKKPKQTRLWREVHIFKKSEDGFALIVSLMFLVLLTLLGFASTTNTLYELQISRNDRSRKSAFYAAEAGRSYVEANSALYDSSNIIQDPDHGISFPTDDTWLSLTETSSEIVSGAVTYLGPSVKYLTDTGNEIGEGGVTAHVYRMTCDGRDIKSGAQKTIEAGFYRVGL